jgi:hypothetical protein
MARKILPLVIMRHGAFSGQTAWRRHHAGVPDVGIKTAQCSRNNAHAHVQ